MATTSIGRPELMAVAASRVYPALRSYLPPDKWLGMRDELDSALGILSDPRRSSEHASAVLTIVSLLSGSEAGREILAGRLSAQDAVLTRAPDSDRAAVFEALAVVDLDAVASASSADRGITLAPGGIGGGRSFKLRNFRVDFAALVKLGAASVASAQAVLAAPHPLVIAAGVLTMAQSLVDTTTVPIGEDETSLFWTFVKTAADRDDRTATEDELRAASGRHRREFGLEPFTPAQFTRALHRLEALSSIRSRGCGGWHLTEAYRVSR